MRRTCPKMRRNAAGEQSTRWVSGPPLPIQLRCPTRKPRPLRWLRAGAGGVAQVTGLTLGEDEGGSDPALLAERVEVTGDAGKGGCWSSGGQDGNPDGDTRARAHRGWFGCGTARQAKVSVSELDLERGAPRSRRRRVLARLEAAPPQKQTQDSLERDE